MTDRAPRRVVIAGGSGFIGSALAAHFSARGDEVRTIGRSRGDSVWSDTAAVARLIDGADVLIGLAGKSVNCRYTTENRRSCVRALTRHGSCARHALQRLLHRRYG